MFANCGTVEIKLFPEVKQVKHVKLKTSTLWPFPATHPLCPQYLSISPEHMLKTSEFQNVTQDYPKEINVSGEIEKPFAAGNFKAN